MAPKTFRSVISSLALAGSLLFPFLKLEAGPVEKNPIGKGTVQVAEAHPMYLGTINSGIKTNDAYTDGNFSIVAPVWSTLGADSTLSGGVLFLEPYVSYGEGGEVAASLGLGYRYLFGNQSVSALTNHDGHQAGFLEEGVFVGANVFVDMLDTEANNQFWQLGVGLEAGTRYLEVRGNYYIPLSDKQVAEEFRTRETFQSTSSQTQTTGGALGDPFATGNTIVQNTGFTTTRTTTTSTTTIERLFRRYEEGMEGWDAELALLVPGLDKYFDLRFIGGYYSFDNQPFGPQEGGTGNVEGWKAGVEIRPVPAVILTGTWYEDERLTGSDWTAGVQLQVPFEMGDLGDGKGFWDRIGDAFTPRRRHLVERLAEPVHRQNAAVKIANTVEEEETETTTSVKRVTKVIASSQGQIVLADDIVFVNNGAAVGNGIQAGTSGQQGATGTAEHPYDTVTEGATTAGTNSNNSGKIWSVYTQGGTGVNYEGVAEATGSTKFISSFTPIAGTGGRNFGGNTARPILDGGIVAFGVPFFQVTAYDIRGGTEAGAIGAENVQQVIIEQNLFDVESDAIRLFVDSGTMEALIQQNRIDGNMETGINMVAQGAFLDVDVLDNDLVASFDWGIHLVRTPVGGVVNGSLVAVNADIVGNRLSGFFDADGIAVESIITPGFDNAAKVTLNISDNELSGIFDRGIFVNGQHRNHFDAVISNNVFTEDSTVSGTGIHIRSITTSRITVSEFQGNVLSGTTLTGILLERSAPGAGQGTIIVNGNSDGNQVSNETGDKLRVVDPSLPRSMSGLFYLNGQLITLPNATSPFVVP